MHKLRVYLLTYTVLFSSLLGLAMPMQAAAVDVFQPCDGTNASNSATCKDVKTQAGSGDNPIVNALKVAIQTVAFVIGIASVLIIIVSGLRMISSAGDAQGAASARNAILYAMIGLAVAALAQILVSFVLNKLD